MAFTFSIKDTYRQAVEAASGGKQTVLYDDKGYPSIMNIIPKLSYKDVGLSDSTKALPAFMVDDAEKPEIFVGTFMAMVHDGRACSLPGQVPKVYTNMDQAIAYCRAKGPGWHCMTNAEYAAIALWCKANGYYPRGNNNYGSDHGYPHEKCRPGTVGSDGRINLGLTGSGPNSWTHDGTPNGIYGLNGDGWEWAIGLRTNNGEIQILTGNNAAKNTADLTAGSAEWKAILPDGTLVAPGTAGTLKIDIVSGVPKISTKLEINDDTGEAAPSHGPVAASSLIQQRRLIIAALEYAVDKGRINRNPGKKTRRPKSKPKTNNILTDEDMETLGIKGTKYRYYPAYMLTLTTACRRGEILGLDWQHVDIGIPWTTVDRYFPWGDIKKLPKWDTKALKTLLEDHNITLGDGYLRLVYQMVDDNGTPFRDELKTDLSRRSLMITEEMVLLLIFCRLIQNTEKKKAAERGIEYNPDNLVFCTRKGTYIYPRNFTKMWSENLRSMGIDHKRFHDLRHTVATVMLEDGEAMNTVQEQLGHYDAGFTASRYGHVTAKMRNSAAVKLGERLEKVRNPEAEDEEDTNSVKKEDTVIPFQEGRKLKSAACKIK